MIELLEAFLDPLALIGSLWCLAHFVGGAITMPYILLGLITFLISYPSPSYLQAPISFFFRGNLLSWATTGGLLLFLGYVTQLIKVFDPVVLIHWSWLAPVSLMAIHLLMRVSAPWLVSLQGGVRRVVIAGMNEQGLALARRIDANRLSWMKVVGYFDDRNLNRSPKQDEFPFLGKFSEMPAYIESANIDAIYMSLPMSSHPRVLSLLDELRDTTVSIYFVPDLFVTSLIHGHIGEIGEIPIVAVWESPFTGINGFIKRLSDVLLSILILLLISPLIMIIAMAVKLSSAGPVIFKQRRYGLDGHEILIYKFRSMTVCEDGDVIRQAQIGDTRITSLGAFLRKTSLDELPQFFNVLQGSMSIVGPRPHAVAHNELYRKVIKGYMTRHKVKPGITGWAQVNGLRGETQSLDKMKLRIDYDLEYLNNWSLQLDLYIIFKTVTVVFGDFQAH